jgi:hypothetical protein
MTIRDRMIVQKLQMNETSLIVNCISPTKSGFEYVVYCRAYGTRFTLGVGLSTEVLAAD